MNSLNPPPGGSANFVAAFALDRYRFTGRRVGSIEEWHRDEMGFYYRKSVGMGPFRLNFSRSGIGASIGGPGFRTGVSGGGRRYTTFSVPGTGLGYRTTGSKAGCLALIAWAGMAAVRSVS